VKAARLECESIEKRRETESKHTGTETDAKKRKHAQRRLSSVGTTGETRGEVMCKESRDLPGLDAHHKGGNALDETQAKKKKR